MKYSTCRLSYSELRCWNLSFCIDNDSVGPSMSTQSLFGQLGDKRIRKMLDIVRSSMD